MPEPQRLAPLPAPSPRGVTAPVIALSVAAACVAGGLAVTAAVASSRRSAPLVSDPCAIPAGLDLQILPPRDRTYVARHAIACGDLEAHRISAADYKLALHAIDLAAQAPAAPVVPPAPIWASTVREMSTQYTDSSWSAARALGAPDVYPGGGDNANAWASRDADAASEFLEVGFAAPHRLSSVDIFETYNPGAVSHVEVITADGVHHTVYDGVARPMNVPSYHRQIDFACTDEPVIGVRVTLASQAVPGWNEIDAIGGTSCD